jgi:hypothetical protein
VDALDLLVAERACERLTYRYCRFADFGEASRLGELFTEDGVFTTPEMTLRGRAEIAATFTQRERLADLTTIHLCTNVDIEVLDHDSARGWVYLCLFRRWRRPGSAQPVPRTAPALVASYEDRYSRVGGQWLIASRTQHVRFADPSDTGWTPPRRP